MRAWGLTKPKHPVLGSDVAGYVEAIGPGVTGLEVGHAVFGDILYVFGGFAQYACAPADNLRPKPESLSFLQAAALPQAACVALEGLRDKGSLRNPLPRGPRHRWAYEPNRGRPIAREPGDSKAPRTTA